MLIIFVRSAASFSCPLFSLLSDTSFWIQFCKREIRKYPLKDLLCHKLSSTYSLLLHHLKLHSYMLNIPKRKMLMTVIALRLFLIYNLLNGTSHAGLNWQHLKSQAFCPLSHFPFLSLRRLSCSIPRGLVWMAAWIKGRNGAYPFIWFLVRGLCQAQVPLYPEKWYYS